MLASLIGRHKAKGAPQGADSTWNIKVYVRNIESLPTKYTRLKVEFRESKGRKAALSEELSASGGKLELPQAKPLLIWQSDCALSPESGTVQGIIRGSVTEREDCTIEDVSERSRSDASINLSSHAASWQSKFFRLSLLRVNSRAVSVPGNFDMSAYSELETPQILRTRDKNILT
jgi:hypothetical protein